jgi:DnaJ-class molecular chaperone
MTMKSTSVKIEICGRCNGTGKEIYLVRTSGHDSEAYRVDCKKCDGSGRIKVTTETTVEAYYP